MNIALFSDTYIPDVNGVAHSTEILRAELEKHGHNAYVVATRPALGFSEWDEKHRVLRLAGVEVKQLYGYAVTTPFHLKALREIAKLDLDLIHVQTEFGVGLFGRFCAKSLGIPLVCSYHTTYEDYTHYINLINSKMVDGVAKKAVAAFSRNYSDAALAVISPSVKTRDLLLKYNVHTQIHVVPTGLQLERFSPDLLNPDASKEIYEKAGFSETDSVIVYVGRIAEEKALDIVIRGFAEAHNAGCTSKLLIVGGGPDEDKLHQMVKELGMEGVIAFAGKQPPERVPDYYRASRAFISASLSETQGMTFVEAMASGIPLFARHDEVLDDLIIPEKTGWFFADEHDLVRCIRELEELSEEEYQAMKTACLKQVVPYSSEIFYEKAMEVYEGAIELFRHMNVIEDIDLRDDSALLYITGEGKEETKIQISLDDYMEEGYRKGTRLSDSQVEELKEREKGLLAYQKCVRRISYKDRTKKEIQDWLKQETDCGPEAIETVIRRLEEKGLIDDSRYAEEAIHRMKGGLQGEDRISRELKKRGISAEIIRQKLENRPEDEEENARMYAEKIRNTIHGESLVMKKRKIRTKMLQRGFSSDIIDRVEEDLDFTSDQSKETENLRKCALKARKRYEKKYTSSQLRNAVYRFCSAHGYEGDDINMVLEEMEWENGEN